MSVWSLKPEPIVGIDISSTAVKLLELSKSGKEYKVESYATEYLPAGSIKDKNIDPEKLEEVGVAINRVVQRAKPRTQYAAVAVAGPAVITRVITMDGGMSDEEMKEQIEEDPPQYLGIDTEDEINFDFQIIGPNEKEPERVDILVAGGFNEIIETRKTVLELGGLKPLIVDIEKYALENAFLMLAQNDPEIDENEVIALLEVGATTTTMNVLSDQKIVYTNEEIFGGKQLTEQIKNHYDLDYEQADLAQRTGSIADDYQTEILEPFKIEMAQQISQMVQFYEAQGTYGKLSHILIAGGCASIADITEHINNKVGGQVTIVNPFAQMSVASRIKKKALMNDAPALMIACGLALRTFD
jgi:type IV pilus assembly protein PilM